MPITEKSTRQPLVKLQRIGHGTLECLDLGKTRRFYEEVLGLECFQGSPISLVVRLGTNHCYAVLQTKKDAQADMSMMNHNGLDVGTPEEVDAAYQIINSIKDEWGLKQVRPVRKSHGDRSFYFCDFDGNWWEIVSVRPGGYVADFDDEDFDISGLHEFDNEPLPFHTHDEAVREKVRRARLTRKST
jgi:catechol 2,3-dioxygenase-like lactoylglutathione lyase family enzyme